MTVPGVSLVSAATFVAVVGDIRRFETPKKLVGYVGLDPKVRQSSEQTARHGRISKQGSAAARHVLCEAAWIAVRTPGPPARLLRAPASAAGGADRPRRDSAQAVRAVLAPAHVRAGLRLRATLTPRRIRGRLPDQGRRSLHRHARDRRGRRRRTLPLRPATSAPGPAWTPTVRSSDCMARLGHISSQGSVALRWALVEAAQIANLSGGPLRETFERLARAPRPQDRQGRGRAQGPHPLLLRAARRRDSLPRPPTEPDECHGGRLMGRPETAHARRRASPLKVTAAASAARPPTCTGPRRPSGERDSIHDGGPSGRPRRPDRAPFGHPLMRLGQLALCHGLDQTADRLIEPPSTATAHWCAQRDRMDDWSVSEPAQVAASDRASNQPRPVTPLDTGPLFHG
jgi:Transposase IS116/IS110/IS902 family